MHLAPLIGKRSPQSILVWRPEGVVTTQEFLRQVHHVSRQLPEGKWLLNMCTDRYHFAVVFMAGLLSGKTSLQPSSQSVGTLQSIQAAYTDVVCVKDANEQWEFFKQLDIRSVLATKAILDASADQPVPEVALDHVAAILFTSGSTGEPQPHRRTFRQLILSAQSEAQGLGLVEPYPVLVGTIPVQHSFGFESTFLLAMYENCAFWSGKPFYAQDVADALAAVPLPRVLVTTPFHLATLIQAGLSLSPVQMVICATAPLSNTLAEKTEAQLQAPVLEIYGSTESSALACRRTISGSDWTLLPGVQLEEVMGATYAFDGHVPSRIALADHLLLHGDRTFLMQGRHADMVNIAGKRTSLEYLNHQVCRIEGVKDAAFFMPEEFGDQRIGRLALCVVAPQLSREQLLTAIRGRIDDVFIPRPLIVLQSLPRNSLGKLPRSALLGIFEKTKYERQ